jgi:RNA polymerase sigma-70 factor (ECF subfamily)
VDQRARLRRVLERDSADLLAYLQRRAEPEDAADLLAEVMLVAWRRVDRLPADDEGARMWLFGVAAKCLANHRRGARRRHALADRVRAEVAVVATAPPEDEAHAVRDAVRRLPDAQRELVMLVHWDGFTLAAAAELVGVPASTARSRYAAAREALRRALVVSTGSAHG